MQQPAFVLHVYSMAAVSLRPAVVGLQQTGPYPTLCTLALVLEQVIRISIPLSLLFVAVPQLVSC